jgi:hypothetical protein
MKTGRVSSFLWLSVSDFRASIGTLDVCFIVDVAGACLGLEGLGGDNALSTKPSVWVFFSSCCLNSATMQKVGNNCTVS